MVQPVLRINSGYPESSPELSSAVKDLQRELQRWGFTVTPNGLFDPATEAAVKAFQRKQGLKDDGIVGSKTWGYLTNPNATNIGGGLSPAVSPPASVAGTGTGPYFPLAKVYSRSWAPGTMGAFGANRTSKDGPRAHAGCDLYAPTGTWVHAITGGTVTVGPYKFYAQSYAVEINHGTFIARYCEMKPDIAVKQGDRVTAGQRLGRVANLIAMGISVPENMLHIELYNGSASGGLTVKGSASVKRADGVPYSRRADLMDPTSYVDQWKSNLPRD